MSDTQNVDTFHRVVEEEFIAANTASQAVGTMCSFGCPEYAHTLATGHLVMLGLTIRRNPLWSTSR